MVTLSREAWHDPAFIGVVGDGSRFFAACSGSERVKWKLLANKFREWGIAVESHTLKDRYNHIKGRNTVAELSGQSPNDLAAVVERLGGTFSPWDAMAPQRAPADAAAGASTDMMARVIETMNKIVSDFKMSMARFEARQHSSRDKAMRKRHKAKAFRTTKGKKAKCESDDSDVGSSDANDEEDEAEDDYVSGASSSSSLDSSPEYPDDDDDYFGGCSRRDRHPDDHTKDRDAAETEADKKAESRAEKTAKQAHNRKMRKSAARDISATSGPLAQLPTKKATELREKQEERKRDMLSAATCYPSKHKRGLEPAAPAPGSPEPAAAAAAPTPRTSSSRQLQHLQEEAIHDAKHGTTRMTTRGAMSPANKRRRATDGDKEHTKKLRLLAQAVKPMRAMNKSTAEISDVLGAMGFADDIIREGLDLPPAAAEAAPAAAMPAAAEAQHPGDQPLPVPQPPRPAGGSSRSPARGAAGGTEGGQ